MKRTNIQPPRAAKQRATYAAYAQRAKARMTKVKKERTLWDWALGDESGQCLAFTRSEAKGIVKEMMGITKGRLPKEVTVVARTE